MYINRGEIYYVDIPYYTGSEMSKNRPAVIVSCDELNHSSSICQVVYLTASIDRTPEPGHVEIFSSRKQSLALCEQLYTIDQSRISSFIGRVTPGEMAKIEKAICTTLGMKAPEPEIVVEQYEPVETLTPTGELLAVQKELEVYKTLYENLLDRLTKTA